MLGVARPGQARPGLFTPGNAAGPVTTIKLDPNTLGGTVSETLNYGGTVF